MLTNIYQAKVNKIHRVLNGSRRVYNEVIKAKINIQGNVVKPPKVPVWSEVHYARRCYFQVDHDVVHIRYLNSHYCKKRFEVSAFLDTIQSIPETYYQWSDGGKVFNITVEEAYHNIFIKFLIK